jgi:Tfp pilus assembly protein PilF
MPDERTQMAIRFFHEAYVRQMNGELELAIDLYKRSIQLYPTAEAYTFLGWTYRFQGKLDQAIEQCKNAILIDPTFGNPYNDIGAYLLEQNKPDEAMPWLEKAIVSKRYGAYHYPWCNLGRAYIAKQMYTRARECFEKALEIEPDYSLAVEHLRRIKALLQ